MTGDQVYADDVAGPMLRAIHSLIERLGLFDEQLDGAVVADSQALYQHPASYYHRATCCQRRKPTTPCASGFFWRQAQADFFSSSNADNHLVTLAEVMAMYLLVWSPVPWQLVDMAMPSGLTDQRQARYRQELPLIQGFAGNLARWRG